MPERGLCRKDGVAAVLFADGGHILSQSHLKCAKSQTASSHRPWRNDQPSEDRIKGRIRVRGRGRRTACAKSYWKACQAWNQRCNCSIFSLLYSLQFTKPFATSYCCQYTSEGGVKNINIIVNTGRLKFKEVRRVMYLMVTK